MFQYLYKDYSMEIQQLDLLAKWLELQRDRLITIEEYEKSEEDKQEAAESSWSNDWKFGNCIGRMRHLQEINKEDHIGYKNFLRVDADM